MRDFREQNYYELLDVKPHASQQELERSYQRARRFFSSDSVATYALFQPDELVLLRRRIEEAYRVLIDPERRQLYDRSMAGLGGAEWDGADEVKSEGDQGSTPETEPVARADERQLPLKPREEPPPLPKKAAPPGEARPETRSDQAGQQAPDPESESERQPDREREPAAATTDSVPPADSVPAPIPDKVIPPRKILAPATPLPPMPEITEETEYSGDLLRQIREARGLSLEKIADKTKISIYYLRNIEKDNYAELPAEVYVRGYIRQFAMLLDVDVEAVVRGYLDKMNKPAEPEKD
jgi:curved DNA-binding protein CbpA